VHFVDQVLIQGLFIDEIVIAIATTKMRGTMYRGVTMLAESFSINKETVAVLAKAMTCATLVLFDSIFAPKTLVTFLTEVMHLRPLGVGQAKYCCQSDGHMRIEPQWIVPDIEKI